MNWHLAYNTLIANAQKKNYAQADGVFEKHHIVPRCTGGSDDFDNLVRLTPREHFVAHKLLTRMYPDQTGLRQALRRMWYSKRYPNVRLTSRQVQALREDLQKETSKRSTAAMARPERRERQKEIAKGMHTEEAKQKQKLAVAKWRAMPGVEEARVAAVRESHRVNNWNARRVFCVETSTHFSSLDAVVAWLQSKGLPANKSAISRACSKKRTSAGFTWVFSEDTIEAVPKAHIPPGRPVVCVTTGVRFASAKKAAQWVRETLGNKAASNNITICCQGKRPKAFGFEWKYADPT